MERGGDTRIESSSLRLSISPSLYLIQMILGKLSDHLAQDFSHKVLSQQPSQIAGYEDDPNAGL